MRSSFPIKSGRVIVRVLSALIAACFAGGALHAQSLPPNIDFALGNFSNWLCYVGYANTGTTATGPYFTGAVLSGPLTNRHTITSGSGVDPVGGFPIVAPGGAPFSLKIGKDSIDTRAERVRYNIHVPTGTTKFAITCKFAVVFEDPGHMAADQPAFQVVAYDSATGAVIPSANNLYISGYSIPGFTPFGGVTTVQGSYLPWTASTINLSGYGGKTVTVEVTALACTLGGHWGYGYFDVTGAIANLAPTAVNCNLATNSITLQGPPGYQYYQWFDQNFSTALNSPLDTTRTRTFSLPGTAQYYNLVVYPYSSTGIPDTLRTPVMNGFTVNASPSSTTCITPGTSLSLNALVSGGATGLAYQWSGPASFSSSSIANPIAIPSGPGRLIVTVSDSNGCNRKDTVNITMGSYHVNAGRDTTTCIGTSKTINASVTPSSPNYTYSWSPATGLSSATVLKPTFTPSAGGTQQYILTVDSNGCSISDTVNIRTLPNTFASSDTTVCAGVNVVPQVQGDTTFSYTWAPSIRLTFPSPAYGGSDQRPSFAADTTTTFTITASYAACPSVTKQLTVHVEPVPLVSIGSDTLNMNALFPINISTNVSPSWFTNYAYSWSPSTNIDSPNNASINFSGANDTSLVITVNTPAGCVGRDTVFVSVSNASLMAIPNAFSPGSATNNTFRVVNVDPSVTFSSMHIYNRWGQSIFQTTRRTEGWDGTRNGSAQPTGVYIYVLEARDKMGRAVMQKGNVTLLR
jgi:gliding motility-associated-like protein